MVRKRYFFLFCLLALSISPSVGWKFKLCTKQTVSAYLIKDEVIEYCSPAEPAILNNLGDSI